MSAKLSFYVILIATVVYSVNAKFDERCARVLCHVQTSCNVNHPFGPYKISWPYWADAGKPTVDGELLSSETAFQNCLKSEKCNFDAVSNYMRNFEQDCDNDGKVDCLDYVKIHVFGGYGCQGDLPIHLHKKFEQAISGNV